MGTFEVYEQPKRDRKKSRSKVSVKAAAGHGGGVGHGLMFVCASMSTGSTQGSVLAGKLPIISMPEVSLTAARCKEKPLVQVPEIAESPDRSLPVINNQLPKVERRSMDKVKRDDPKVDQSSAHSGASFWEKNLRPEKVGIRSELVDFAKAAEKMAYDRLKEVKEREWAEEDKVAAELRRRKAESEKFAEEKRTEEERRKRKDEERIVMEALWEEERQKAVAARLQELAAEAGQASLEPVERAKRNRAARIALGSVPRIARKDKKLGKPSEDIACDRRGDGNIPPIHDEPEDRADRRLAQAREMAVIKQARRDDLDSFIVKLAVEVEGSARSLDTRILHPSETASGRSAAIHNLSKPTESRVAVKVPGVVRGGIVSVIDGHVATLISPSCHVDATSPTSATKQEHEAGKDDEEEARVANLLRRWADRGRDSGTREIQMQQQLLMLAQTREEVQHKVPKKPISLLKRPPTVLEGNEDDSCGDSKVTAPNENESVSAIVKIQNLAAVVLPNLIGRSVLKDFPSFGLFTGVVSKVSFKDAVELWTVKYEDGDEEELTREELEVFLIPLKEDMKENVTKVSIEVPSGSEHAQLHPAGDAYIGRSILKEFGDHGFFRGRITAFVAANSAVNEDLWTVVYEDEDEEDLNWLEVQAGLAVFDKNAENEVEKSDYSEDEFEDPTETQFVGGECSDDGLHPKKSMVADSDHSKLSVPGSESPVEHNSDAHDNTVGESPIVSQPSGDYFIGHSILKEFDGHGVFHGKVMAFAPAQCLDDEDLWTVAYDDGDEEDLNKIELEAGLTLMKESQIQRSDFDSKRAIQEVKMEIDVSSNLHHDLRDERPHANEEDDLTSNARFAEKVVQVHVLNEDDDISGSYEGSGGKEEISHVEAHELNAEYRANSTSNEVTAYSEDEFEDDYSSDYDDNDDS